MTHSVVRSVIDRVEQQLDGATRGDVMWLSVVCAPSDTQLTVDGDIPPSVRPGAVLSAGSELMRVVSTTPSGHLIDVRRGWRSTPQAHAVGAEIAVNARFTRLDMLNAMVAEITSWGDRLWWVDEQRINVTEDTRSIDVAADDALAVLEVRRRGDRSTWPRVAFRTQRGSMSATGMRLRLIPPLTGAFDAGELIIQIARPYDVTSSPLSETDDLVADHRLDGSMIELVELGMRMRLMTDAESARTSRRAQDEPRRAEETPAGAALTVGQTLRANYTRRFGEEQRRLQRQYPLRGT